MGSHPGLIWMVQQFNKSIFRGVWGHYAALPPTPSPVVGFEGINRSVGKFPKKLGNNLNVFVFVQCVIITK